MSQRVVILFNCCEQTLGYGLRDYVQVYLQPLYQPVDKFEHFRVVLLPLAKFQNVWSQLPQHHLGYLLMFRQQIKRNFQRLDLRIILQKPNQSINYKIKLLLLNIILVLFIGFPKKP